MHIGRAVAAATGSLAMIGLPLATATAAPAPHPSEQTLASADRAQPVKDASVASTKTACRGNNHGAYACFYAYGDYFHVSDTKADGKSAGVYWKVANLGDSWCINSHGKGSTVKCDWNLPEGRKITFWTFNYDSDTHKYTNWSWSKTATT